MEILCEVRNHIAHITLNRPAALNALSLSMVDELRTQLLNYARAAEVYAILIRGAGEKAFCAGGDIRALYEAHKASGSTSLEFFEREYPLDYLLRFYPKPYLALLDGIVMGGGMGISQGAHWRIVGERTRMAMPEVAIGFFPDVGGSYFLSRLEGGLGNYLALTGNQMRAADAVYAGLADSFLSATAAAQLPAVLDSLSWTSGASVIEVLGTALLTLTSDPGAAPLAAMREAIDRHFMQDEVAAIVASLETESRPAFTEWAQQTLTILRSRSPTMLKVALAQLARGRALSFADCLRMEIGMTQNCYQQGDFFEGVRALVIDKDNKPGWRPSRLEDVSAAQVERILRNPWEGGVHPLAHIEGVLESCN